MHFGRCTDRQWLCTIDPFVPSLCSRINGRGMGTEWNVSDCLSAQRAHFLHGLLRGVELWLAEYRHDLGAGARNHHLGRTVIADIGMRKLVDVPSNLPARRFGAQLGPLARPPHRRELPQRKWTVLMSLRAAATLPLYNPTLGLKTDNRYLRKRQMDLAFNHNAKFTKWVVSRGLLTEPFVLIDVGVQGGEHIRWRALDDYLIVHGFDPIEEVIQELAEANKGRSNHHYHCMAVGNADGEQKFYFNTVNPTASSMVPKPTGWFGVETVEQHRMVPIRRLDSLLAEGVIPMGDHIKIDVEGIEKDVLLGAHDLLGGGVLGLDAETNFGISPAYPKSHFGALAEIALENHLVVFDLAFNRFPRASFQQALIGEGLQPIIEQDAVGTPATVNVLFARDLTGEVDHPNHYQTPCRPVSVNQLIKSIIIYELYALNDVALDTVERFAERLGAQLDVERAVRLLADPDCVTNEYRKQLSAQRRGYEQQLSAQRRGYEQQLRDYEEQLRAQRRAYEQVLNESREAQRRAYEQSTSWRITAPLRWVKLLFGAPRQQPPYR